MIPPNPDAHGVWVRSVKMDTFGRIAYRGFMGDTVGYWCVWEPQGSMGKRAVSTASFHTAQDLIVRPYKPRPWFRRTDETETVVKAQVDG